ncbi:MAG TPA: YdeI/OmpD-associated family protein [Clostridia bacterium]|nr:YdeI/OmpD-associated family protein [Clostridia bacterium]
MEQTPFIGMGNNPDGPDLPIGLSMQLAQEPQAVTNYGRLSKAEQASVIRYIQNCSTGEDAENKIAEAVQCLKENNLGKILPTYRG